MNCRSVRRRARREDGVRARLRPRSAAWKAILRALACTVLWQASLAVGAPADAVPEQPLSENVRHARLREHLADLVERRMQRLRENGLEHLVIYRALGELRSNPAGAAALAWPSREAAPRQPGDDSPDSLRREAAAAIQSLVTQPRDLRRRLKLAELKQAALDAHGSPNRLRRLLVEVRRWPGSLGRLAAEGLERLDQSGIAGVVALIEDFEPLIALDREAALACADDLSERQAEIFADSQQAELSAQTADDLVAQQAAIRQALDQWSAVLGRTPHARQLVPAATAAAETATRRLFDLDAQASAAAQREANDCLAQLSAIFRRAVERGRAELDDADWAARAAELTSTREFLSSASRQLAASPTKDQLGRLAQELEQLFDGSQLPSLVDAELLRTLLIVRGAVSAWQSARDDDERAGLIEQSRRAFDRAASACAAELARGRPAPSSHVADDESAGADQQLLLDRSFDLTRQPWFSKLPPENQRAIRSRDRPFPLGYEERLKKYFDAAPR